MRRLARFYLAVLGAALIVPTAARAWGDLPVPRSSTGVSSTPHRHGLFGKGYTCPTCAAKAQARANPAMSMPDGAQIVGCAHSQNGVCASCKALLAMPGQVTTVGAPAAASALTAAGQPGHATASDSPSGPGYAVAEAGEPEPIGVMQTNFRASRPGVGAAGAPTGNPASAAMPSAAPGRAPFLTDAGEKRPNILSHLFGFSAMSRDFQEGREMKARRKKESHAAISYGETTGTISDIPASMVYGKKSH